MEVIYLGTPEAIEQVAERVATKLSSSYIPDRFLTETEAMELLKVSRPTLRKWRREGHIPFTRVGQQLRYKRSELEKVLKTKTEKS